MRVADARLGEQRHRVLGLNVAQRERGGEAHADGGVSERLLENLDGFPMADLAQRHRRVGARFLVGVRAKQHRAEIRHPAHLALFPETADGVAALLLALARERADVVFEGKLMPERIPQVRIALREVRGGRGSEEFVNGGKVLGAGLLGECGRRRHRRHRRHPHCFSHRPNPRETKNPLPMQEAARRYTETASFIITDGIVFC